jgi:hypothetical protein
MSSTCNLNTPINIFNIENFLQLNSNDIIAVKMSNDKIRTLETVKIISKRKKKVEIKPKKQTVKPTPKKNKRAHLNECITYETNTCKWKAAEIYCKERGWVFKILTEDNLFRA